GRSNVGKSSLLNAIAGRKLLARTSRQPGRTQGLIFFSVRDCLTLVDMPGYGYAKAPKSTIASWTRLSDAYLRGRTCLKLVLVLIDARRGIGASDHALMGRLDGWAVAFMPVLTKIDCIPAAHLDQLETRCCELMKDHPAGAACAVMTSAKKCLGIDRLRHIICLRGGLKSSQPKNGSARVN
ncbi:MAG: ribosome biogenesis GTP-binding protein YihA/YsxC, partial [Pseudomonadota bacterium]